MTYPAEILARLTARSALRQTGGMGSPFYKGAELAGCLSGISRGAQLLAFFRYLDDKAALEELAGWLEETVGAGLARDRGHGPLLRSADLIRLALWECLEPHVCRHCKGRGIHYGRGKASACADCQGTGQARIRNAKRARFLGISRQAFAQNRARDYGVILYWVRVRIGLWDDEIGAKLRREMA